MRQGQPLVQSDGLATGAGDRLIDVNVPAGMDFLEVQSLSGGGTYQITANVIPTVPAFQTVPTDFPGSLSDRCRQVLRLQFPR